MSPKKFPASSLPTTPLMGAPIDPCAVFDRPDETFTTEWLDAVLDAFHRVLNTDEFEIIASGQPEEGIGGREIAADPEQGVLVRARREDRRGRGTADYSIRVRSVSRASDGERWLKIDAYGDSMGGEFLDLRVGLSSDGNAIDATLGSAFEMLRLWNRVEN